MQASRRFVRMVAIASVALLASCGGGGDDGGNDNTPPAPSNTPPASASSSVDGFIAYLQGLVVTRQDTSEPLDVTAFVAPTSDTTEPDASI